MIVKRVHPVFCYFRIIIDRYIIKVNVQGLEQIDASLGLKLDHLIQYQKLSSKVKYNNGYSGVKRTIEQMLIDVCRDYGLQKQSIQCLEAV